MAVAEAEGALGLCPEDTEVAKAAALRAVMMVARQAVLLEVEATVVREGAATTAAAESEAALPVG